MTKDDPQQRYFGQVLTKIAQHQFNDGRYNEIAYDRLNDESYDNLRLSYRIALAARGIDDEVTTLFGNSVGTTFVSYSQDLAQDVNISPLEVLFELYRSA